MRILVSFYRCVRFRGCVYFLRVWHAGPGTFVRVALLYRDCIIFRRRVLVRVRCGVLLTPCRACLHIDLSLGRSTVTPPTFSSTKLPVSKPAPGRVSPEIQCPSTPRRQQSIGLCTQEKMQWIPCFQLYPSSCRAPTKRLLKKSLALGGGGYRSISRVGQIVYGRSTAMQQLTKARTVGGGCLVFHYASRTSDSIPH